MNTPDTPAHCTAFIDDRRVAHGRLDEVAQALVGQSGAASALIFDDATGALIDAPPPPEHAARLAATSMPTPAPAVGRPRLGVVAREVTLLPRHWQWLAAQPGGASAALRRLVDEARKTHAGRDARRGATERTYRCMSALAGHRPGFEEAARALFAHDGPGFDQRMAAWPSDVRTHLAWLARDAFD